MGIIVVPFQWHKQRSRNGSVISLLPSGCSSEDEFGIVGV